MNRRHRHWSLCSFLVICSCSKGSVPLEPGNVSDSGVGDSPAYDFGVSRPDSGPRDAGREDSGADSGVPMQEVRGSLVPLFQLTPPSEYGRIGRSGRTMSDADFAAQNVSTSVAQRLAEIRELLPEGALQISAEDSERASQMQFRGNPSDAKVLEIDGATKVYVPLGGDVTMPGDEVAVVVDNVFKDRIRVGLRPQRLAVHPAGLIFVCNQYSNYISIIDPNTDQLLRSEGAPVEIPTDYFCTDLVLLPANVAEPDDDEQVLYVANRWLPVVLKYRVSTTRDPSGRVATVGATLVTAIPLVGHNPYRLAVDDQQGALYVANNKGGEVTRIDLRSEEVSDRVSIGAPAADVVVIDQRVYVPTTTPDRGLLAADDQIPALLQAEPVRTVGLDGAEATVHPGALFDSTKAYNFEDLRNGIMDLDLSFNGRQYYADDNTPEPNFVEQQKIVAGALPTTIIRNRAGTAVYVALAGSRLVQELNVNTSSTPFTLTPSGKLFNTGHRPFGLALNAAEDRLYVANWGSETLEVFDVAEGGAPIATVDLGYADPVYPASNVERGELAFFDASWSNNGRKACAGCHFDELDTDGLSFSNGALAPTGLHQVKPHHNLMTTDAYFSNGSFANGDFSALAFAAQTRTNCELIAYGMVEGIGSDPALRVGDPNNELSGANDIDCRPVTTVGNGTVDNQAAIDEVVADERLIAAQRIQAATGFAADEVKAFLDFYSAAELRLPPNPIRQLYQRNQLDVVLRSRVEDGQRLFETAGCDVCHDPFNVRAPYSDGKNHGRGADWIARFVNQYQNTGAIPATMLNAVGGSVADAEVNVFLEPIESYVPFCFEVTNCVAFLDPLATTDPMEQDERLQLLLRWNLLDPELGFVPGSVIGAPALNTPSLRGVWTQPSLLHHGLAVSIPATILGPGHTLGRLGEHGFAWSEGRFNVHGATRDLEAPEIDALVLFVESIE